jgi:hypothetical protein
MLVEPNSEIASTPGDGLLTVNTLPPPFELATLPKVTPKFGPFGVTTAGSKVILLSDDITFKPVRSVVLTGTVTVAAPSDETLGIETDTQFGFGVGVFVAVLVAVLVGVFVDVFVGVLVAVLVGVAVGAGVPDPHGIPVIVSIFMPTAATLESVATRHLSRTLCPFAAGGRFTVDVT